MCHQLYSDFDVPDKVSRVLSAADFMLSRNTQIPAKNNPGDHLLRIRYIPSLPQDTHLGTRCPTSKI